MALSAHERLVLLLVTQALRTAYLSGIAFLTAAVYTVRTPAELSRSTLVTLMFKSKFESFHRIMNPPRIGGQRYAIFATVEE